jgi:two-component system sensor histidine kinase BaeS
MMGVLRVSGRIYGTILVVGRDHPFSRQEGQLLATFAVPIVLAIEDAEIYQRLREHRKQLLLARDKLERVWQIGERMRRPLAVIQGYLGLLLDGAMGEVPGSHAATLSMLSEKARELSAMVNQLLPSHPLPATDYYGPVRLADLVGRALELQHAQLEEAELEIVTDLPPPDADQCIASGDPEALLAVFNALIGNATQASPRGGSIHVSLSRLEETNCFRVDDQGADMPAARLMRIWQDQDRTAGPDAISLAMVKQVVDDHGGQVWAESIRSQGNTFYVVLPRYVDQQRNSVDRL